jgi:hypothetical protein
MASHGQIPRFALGVQRTTRGASPTLSTSERRQREHTKREFEQKVAKVTKGIRVGLGGGWRHPAKSPGFALDVRRTTRGASWTLSTSERRQREHTKREFEQKVAKGIRVGLGGGWRLTAKSPGFALDVQRTTRGASWTLSTSERRQRNTQKRI